MASRHTAQLARRARQERDARAALALLEHSMAQGHRRVALIRYLQAEHLGARLDARHHDYVRRIAARLRQEDLARLAAHALTDLRRRAPAPPAPHNTAPNCAAAAGGCG